MASGGWGWDKLKSLAQDADWKQISDMAQTAVQRVGTGIDRAIGVPENNADGKARQPKRAQVKRTLNVRRRSSTLKTSELPAKTSEGTETSSSNETQQSSETVQDSGHAPKKEQWDDQPLEIPSPGLNGEQATQPQVPNHESSPALNGNSLQESEQQGGMVDVSLESASSTPHQQQAKVDTQTETAEHPKAQDESTEEAHAAAALKAKTDELKKDDLQTENAELENAEESQLETTKQPQLAKTTQQSPPETTQQPDDIEHSATMEQPATSKQTVESAASKAGVVPKEKSGAVSDTKDVVPASGPQSAEPDIDPITLEILSQAKEEYERLEEHTNRIEEQNKKLRKALAEAKKIEATLRAREQQIQTLSRENARVSQQNTTFKADLGKSDDENRALKGKISLLTSKLSEVASLKQQLKDSNKKLERTQRSLEEKERDVKQVIKEGQDMSKKQHGKDVLIRNLRKEVEAKQQIIEKQKRDLEAKVADMRNAKTRADAASNEAEETTTKLSLLQRKNHALSERLLEVEKESQRYQQACSKYQDQMKIMQQQLHVKDAKIQKAIASLTERKKEKEELQTQVDKLESKVEALNGLYENARISLKKAEKRAQSKEEDAADQEKTLQKQMQEMRKKMHEADIRNQELADAIPNATRPLLRQINMLSNTMKSQQNSWTMLEQKYKRECKQYADKLREIQLEGERKERMLKQQKQKVEDSTKKLSAATSERSMFQSKCKRLNEKISDLEEIVKELREEANQLKVNKDELLKQKKRVEEKSQQLMVSTRLEHNKLRKTLDDERRRRKELMKKLRTLKEKTGEKPNAGMKESPRLEVETEEQVMLTTLTGKDDGGSSVGRNGDAWQLVNRLKADVRQREGELFSLRQRLSILEEHRKILSEKMAQATNANLENETKLQNALKTEKAYKDVSSRYALAVDIIGEKEEELIHLRHDLQHLKSTFRDQAQDLLKQIEELKQQLRSQE